MIERALTRAAVAAMLAVMPGCVAPADDPALHDWPVPPDFALQVQALAATPAQPDAAAKSRDLADMTCQFLVEPDRKLRVGFGPRVTARIHPAVRTVLSPQQVQRLYVFVRERGLLTPPEQPPETADASTRYELAITAAGRTRRYRTTRDRTPAAADLIYLLADFASIERTP
jgi:hypothetical protein